MAFTVTLNGNTYTEASFDEYAYSNENTGLAAALQDTVKHTRDALKSPSSTNINLSTLVVSNVLSILVAVDKYFEVDQTVLIYSSQVSTDFVYGRVTSYTASTGALSLIIKEVGGAATHSNWVVVLGLGKFSQQVEDDAIAAAASASAAASSASAAAIAETGAGDAQAYAEEWAIAPEDTAVSSAAGGNGTTTFSSLHWAAKSAADGHSHSNQAVLDASTAPFQLADEVKLDNLPAVGDVVQKGTAGTISVLHTLAGSNPGAYIQETDAPANDKLWQISVNGEQLYLKAKTDANALVKDLMLVSREGNVVLGGNLGLLGGSGGEGSQIDFAASPTSTLSEFSLDVYGNSTNTANFRMLQRDSGDTVRSLVFPPVDGTVWSSGNQGSGSGLDADTLDTHQAAAFGRMAVSNTWTAQQYFKELRETTYSLSGTVIDPANGTIQLKVLGANTTFTSAIDDGQSVTLMLADGSGRVAFWPSIAWVWGSAPTLPTSGYAVIELWKFGGTLFGSHVGNT